MTVPLQRDLQRLGSTAFDVLVIGGGIYGLTVAYDAAQRGLSVALVERNDFGSGSSFNHLRTIHGGLRYLQTLDFARARESMRERRALARIAPWALRPLAFVLPLSRSLTRGAFAMRAAFVLDSVVSAGRNQDVPAELRLPRGRVTTAAEAGAVVPEIQGTPMTAAAVWYDYVTAEPERLTLAWALGAAAHAAALANYVEARALTSADGHVTGAAVVDRIGGREFHVAARTVVNATGSQVNALLAPFGAGVTVPLLLAMNLVTRLPAPAAAIGGRSREGQNFFLVPWRDRALFGTWESPSTRGANDLTVTQDDVTGFLSALNDAFPSRPIVEDDVTFVHRGLVPAIADMEHDPSLEGRELVFEHRPEGLEGAISVVGTKYTTARAVAERIVDRLFALLRYRPEGCRSDEVPLPHVALQGEPLLRHSAESEMVVTLADAVMRRTALGSLGCPDDRTLAQAASIVGATHGWSAARQDEEIAAVRRLY